MHVKSNETFDINCHCDSIIDFLSNSYFIVQIYHAKSFKMKYIRSLYLNFLLRYLKRHFNVHKTLISIFLQKCFTTFFLQKKTGGTSIYTINELAPLKPSLDVELREKIHWYKSESCCIVSKCTEYIIFQAVRMINHSFICCSM